jgi:phosphatidate cytidylyltransferase
MTPADIVRRAALWWLLFPAIAIPVGLIARRRGHPGILRRFLPWVPIVPLTMGASYAGPPWFAALLAGCAVAVAWELARLGGPADGGVRWMLLAPVVAGWTVWALRDPAFPDGLAAAFVVLPIGLSRVWRVPPGWDRVALASSAGAALAFWMRLETLPDGFRFVLYAFSTIAIADVMAFAIGRIVGGPRPFPRLSPHKTAAGYAGGAIGALIVAGLLSFVIGGLTWTARVMLAIVLAASGAAGDLVASGVKRRYGIKDFSALLGAQGGMLDRLDSLLGAGWVFYLLLRLRG